MIALIRQVRYKFMILVFQDETFDLSTAELIDRKFLTEQSAKEYAIKKVTLYTRKNRMFIVTKIFTNPNNEKSVGEFIAPTIEIVQEKLKEARANDTPDQILENFLITEHHSYAGHVTEIDNLIEAYKQVKANEQSES